MVFTELLPFVLVYRKQKMKSLIIKQVENYKLEPDYLEIPRVTSETAILKVEACGLCGSDVEQYKGSFGFVTYPLIPGHEPIGKIVEIGEEAKKRWEVKKDDFVALEPQFPGHRSLALNHWWHHLYDVDFGQPWSAMLYVLRDDDAVLRGPFKPADVAFQARLMAPFKPALWRLLSQLMAPFKPA